MSGTVLPPVAYLFVPGNREDRIRKALKFGAEVIVDLEDAVAEDEKDAARCVVASADLFADSRVHVRINPLGSQHHEADLRIVAELPWVSTIVVPKVESANDIVSVRRGLHDEMEIVAIIESARGLCAAEEVAESGIKRILFGIVDYLADIKVSASRHVLLYPRSRLVVASTAANLAAPVDGPTLLIQDQIQLRVDAEEAKSLGMAGKLCIHPNQIPVVREVFQSSIEELQWARGVLEAAEHLGGNNAFMFESAMVDKPVIMRAREILGIEAGTDKTDSSDS
jgi:citrate lyase subunit beta/citryl-CoA lyase